MIDTDISPFDRLWSYGYRQLVPIVPPNAEPGPTSTLFKRIGTKDDPRGKVPGTKGRNGKWYGFDWMHYEADRDDLRRWHSMGAGVGIKTGNGLVAIDADSLDRGHATIIRDEIDARFGRLPVRVGNAPKAIYLCRVDGPLPYLRVEFGSERVELLTEGRQFVASGVHPKTGQPYSWPREIVPYDELPVFKPEDFVALLEALRAKLPEASRVIQEGGGKDVDQETLKGDLDTVRKAVTATRNTTADFPSRENYIQFGYAVKAALQEHPDEAFEIFSEWSDRWEDDEGRINDPGFAEAEWRRMKGPFKRGASWLYEQAERHGTFDRAEAWFTAIEPSDNPFTEIELNALKGGAENSEAAPPIKATPYGFPDPGSIPRRQFLYGVHYVRQFLSATVAPSGVGKSSLEVVEALAMATGKPLLGVTPRGKFRVWLWNGEDPREEMERRIAAAMMHYGLTRDDVGDRLFLDTGRETEIVLATETREGVRIAAPVVSALVRTIEANKLDVVQIDPFVSSHRVSENDNGAIDLVTKQWAKIADATRTSIELVHHVRKLNGAEITVEDSRGAGALIATSRSTRALTKMTKGEAARLGLPEGSHKRLFRFGDAKNNLALPADERASWMELASVALGNGEGAAGSMDRAMNGDSVGVVTRWEMPEASASLPSDERSVALGLIRAGVWRRDVRSGEAWVGVPISQALGLDVGDETDRARVKAVISEWIKGGVLREVTRLDVKRMARTFVEVAEAFSKIELNALKGSGEEVENSAQTLDNLSDGLFG